MCAFVPACVFALVWSVSYFGFSHDPALNSTVRVSGNMLIDGSGQAIRLLGVNMTETDDMCTADTGLSWGSDGAVAKAIASWDANSVRIYLNEDCWLGINGVSAQYSGVAYQAAIEGLVAALNQDGIVAILDLQWSAPGAYVATGQSQMPDADHSVSFWSQVAKAFASDPSVIFDLFNEPALGGTDPTSADWFCWLNGCDATYTSSGGSQVVYATAGMQQLVNTVRATGATQPIMVPGLNWAGDPCGVYDTGGNGGSCAWLAYEPSDPLHQLVVSFHTYNWTSCRTLSCWNTDVAPLAAKVPVVTDEFGEADCATTYITNFMNWADQNGISYLAASWGTPDAGDTTCTHSTGGSDPGDNLELLSNWSGAPSVLAPQGAAIRTNLLTQDARPLHFSSRVRRLRR